jgi:hypothetical protein
MGRRRLKRRQVETAFTRFEPFPIRELLYLETPEVSMNTPIQARPVARPIVGQSGAAREEETAYPGEPAHDSPGYSASGVVALGYEQCYRLRGPAQDMCLSQYF